MEASAPFIVRGEFVYHDVLLVDVGGALKRHACASPSEIKTLLDGKGPKDQVAHWYEAQLIHYGLPRSKDKNTAKVRLQQALSQKKLKVPPHIVDMEAQMRKEYASSIKKARNAASKAIKEADIGGKLAKGTKRKQTGQESEPLPTSSKKTKVTMKIGGVEVSIDHGTAGAASTATKNTKIKVLPSSPATATSPAKSRATIKTTPRPTKKPPITPQIYKANDNDAQNSTASHSRKSMTELLGLQPVIPTPQKRAVKTETKVKREPSASPQSPAKSSPKAKVKPESSATNVPTQRFITGVYNVSSPQLEAQFPHVVNNLRFFLCVDNDVRKIWGGLELGPKSGVICLTDNYNDPDALLSFRWRARDLETGRLSFSRECFGEIRFFDDGRFNATVYNMFSEPIDFGGERRPGPLWCGKSAWQFEREWEGFLTEAYGR